MKIIVAILIFLSIFALSGYYVYIRVIQSFTYTFINSKLFLVLYIFLISSFLLGKISENISISIFSNTLVRIGSVSIAVFLYALLFVIFYDFVRLINFIIPFFPKFIIENYQKTKFFLGIFTISAIFIILTIGWFNARYINIKNIKIDIKKEFNTLNIVAISDIHLGTMVNDKKTLQLTNTIQKINPDLVIIAGDIIDDNLSIVKYFKLLEHFKKLNPKYGIYACPGNHEYISRAYTDYEYFEKNGINILNDITKLIDNKFYIIGRDDLQGEGITKKKRKSLQELTKNIDFKLPVILLDHQPFKLNKTAEYNIDLQFSGHTHNGQIFPFNFITGFLFEEDWGYIKKKNTHFYISSGYGTAVIPIRIGSHSEIVNIIVN